MSRARVALVAYGDATNPQIVSGVPYGVLQQLIAREDVDVFAINARPRRIVRTLAKLTSFRNTLTRWQQQYMYGPALLGARSTARNWALRRHGEFDLVVHVRGWYRPLKVPYAAFIDATGETLYGTTPQWDTGDRLRRFRFKHERAFYKSAAFVFCASTAACKSLIEDYDVAPARAVYVGNGRNLAGISELSSQRIADAFRAKRVLFIGRDRRRKRLDDVVQAVQQLRRAGSDVSLDVVGPSDASDLPDWVRYHGRVENRDRLHEIFSSASVFCLPSAQESFGLVVAEALAFGLPCIVSDVGEMPSIIGGEAGATVATGDITAIARELERLLEDEALYSKTARAALRRSAEYSWATVVERIMTASSLQRPRNEPCDGKAHQPPTEGEVT